METRRKNTTAGVMFWTPAPARVSPTSSVASETGWEDEKEEDGEIEEEEDFRSQMDENGIIGLKEALEDVELGVNYREGDGECDPPWNAEALDPEEGSFGGGAGARLALEEGVPLEEELSYNLSELQDSEPLSHTEPPGEDTHTLSLYDDVVYSVEVWTEDEELRQREEEEGEQRWLVHRQSLELLPEREKQLDMTEDEREGEEDEGEQSKRNGHSDISGSNTTEFGTGPSWVQNNVAREEGKISSIESNAADLINSEVTGHTKRDNGKGTPESVGRGSGNLSLLSPSDQIHPISQPPSPPRASPFPHLLHFSSEELADAPGIEAEVFPETGFPESLPESHSSCLSQAPKPTSLLESEEEGLSHRTSPYLAATSPTLRMSHHFIRCGDRPTGGSERSAINHCSRPTPAKTPRESPSKTHPRSHDAEVDEARRGPLSYRTPDFSKVEPRVRFPKSGYKPPKSRGSPKKRPLSVEPPLVFKSPADIVKEVLFSSTDGPSPSSDPSGPQTSTANTTIPEEFRCPQQATILVQQLQEDYSRLLTKYADAENTIDRLRLEAKVNLYSDLPKPSHSIQSGVIQDGSKVMTLTFPQAQRAEFSSGGVHLNGHGAHQAGISPVHPSSAASMSSRRPCPQVGQQLSKTVFKLAESFLQQVQVFEDHLKSGKLKPFEQMKGLSQLAQGLDSLERGYLAARDEHRLLQHRGAEMGRFDPDRELEGRIFQCGMRVEELKEQVEQIGQDRPTSAAPPSPPPHPAPLSTAPGRREPMPLPESPVLPVPGESGVVAVEVSSASGESDGEEGGMKDEETLPSLFLRPLNHKHGLVEQDFSSLMDHYQSFKELPKLLDLGLRETASLSPGVGDNMDLCLRETASLSPGVGDDMDLCLRETASLSPGVGDNMDLCLRETASLSPGVGDNMDLCLRETASLSPGVGDNMDLCLRETASLSPGVGDNMDLCLRETASLSPGVGDDIELREEGRETQEAKHQRTGDVESQRHLPQRHSTLGQHDSPPVPTAKPRTSKSNPPSPRVPNQSPTLPGKLSNNSKRAEVRKSHSSSLTSLGESTVSERRGSKLQPGTRRVLSQDGIISPETDSGFVGSESSRLTPAAVHSPLHQRATVSVSVRQERSPGKPQTGPVSGQPLPTSPSHRPPSSEHSGGSRLSTPGQVQGLPRIARGGERRGTSASSSPQHWASHSPQHWAGSVTSEFGPESDHTYTVSEEEEGQSDRYADSTNMQHGYHQSPSPTRPYHHGDPLRSSGQLTNRNEAIQNLQAEVTRLKERLEQSLRKANPPSPVQVPPPAQGSQTHRLTSTPCIRSGQRRRDDSREERRERRMDDDQEEEENTLRSTPRRRSASVPRQRPELHITTDSEHAQSTARFEFSRPAAQGNYCSHSNTVRSRTPPTRQHAGLSAGASEAVDEPDGRRGQAPVCPQCTSHHRARSARPEGGVSETVHTSSRSRHCPLCGRSETYKNTGTEPECRRDREWGPTHRGSRPTSSPRRDVRGAYVAAPAPLVLGSVPLVHCVPVCPPPVLYYSPVVKTDSHPQPLYVSLSGGGVGTSSGVRGHAEARGHTCSLSADDEQRSLSSSLNRAIRAARDMKHTSRHMARSLAAGLHYQEVLSQTCTY